jgi:hypothetical protein
MRKGLAKWQKTWHFGVLKTGAPRSTILGSAAFPRVIAELGNCAALSLRQAILI